MGRIDQNWPPGGEAMARAIFTRTLAYCNGFELQGRKTFTRHLEAAIGSARQGYFQETISRMWQALSEAQRYFVRAQEVAVTGSRPVAPGSAG